LKHIKPYFDNALDWELLGENNMFLSHIVEMLKQFIKDVVLYHCF